MPTLPVQKKMLLYTIGGISINMIPKGTSCSLLQEMRPYQHKEFFCCADAKKKNTHIQAYIKQQQQIYAPSESDKIYTHQQTEFYKTASGYLQKFYPSIQREISSAQIITNGDFSRFDCFLNERIAKSIDLYAQYVGNKFLFMHSLINHQGLIIHAAGGSILNKGMVFAAPSGIGKSTLSRLLLAHPDIHLFSEERLVLRSTENTDEWKIWGTPWKGNGSIARNKTTPLTALIFLTQAERTKITPLSLSAGLQRLLQVVSIPWYSEEWTNKGLAICESLIQKIPIFELAFKPDQSAVQAVKKLASSFNG